MKLNINVTSENIEKAIPSTKCRCPISLAVMACAVKDHGAKPFTNGQNFVEASIDHDRGTMRVSQWVDQSRPAESFRFTLPKVAEQFIRDRDEKLEVSPFSFSTTAEAYTPKSAR